MIVSFSSSSSSFSSLLPLLLLPPRCDEGAGVGQLAERNAGRDGGSTAEGCRAGTVTPTLPSQSLQI